jgi:hypothetical protein
MVVCRSHRAGSSRSGRPREPQDALGSPGRERRAGSSRHGSFRPGKGFHMPTGAPQDGTLFETFFEAHPRNRWPQRGGMFQ